MRAIAVDWSGDLRRPVARRHIVLAEVARGSIVRVEDGRDRDEVVTHLIECADRDPSLAVGIDFAFSFPAWFVRELGCADMGEAWEVVAREGERWLDHCPAPFYGRHRKKRAPWLLERGPFRRTESDLRPTGRVVPKSVFQLAGSGHVGTGSLRGMPYLRALRAAGFAVWPLDPPRPPVVFEIWPRLFAERVDKRQRASRMVHLQSPLRIDTDSQAFQRAAASDDAFDALVSALAMGRSVATNARLEPARDDTDRKEGRIWRPPDDPLGHLRPFDQAARLVGDSAT